LPATRTAKTRPEVLLERLRDARESSDRLFDIVRPDSLYERPIPERHRIIFYIGHLEAFDWNLLGDRLATKRTPQAEFDRLFAFGIDPVGGGLPSDVPADWPKLDAVRGYAAKVRAALDAALVPSDFSARGADGASLEQVLNVAVEHRLMHLETLAYMFHQLPLRQKIRKARIHELTSRPILPRTMRVPEGECTLGLSREDADSFGWDNEYEQQTVHVPGFRMDEYMVTNSQFRQFMDAGGYDNRDFWTDANWKWKTENEIHHPAFWKKVGKRWMFSGMCDEAPLPGNWPVYVSHAEASAYARWAGKSLPTEAQWHRAAYGTQRGVETEYPWGDEGPSPLQGNFDFQDWDPAPVNAAANHRSAFGMVGMLGNGWEWTSTVFAPFPGFEKFPFYPGYSADFFDGQHYVMKGGSARTAACMLRRSFRNWFQPRYQYTYAGFRCVANNG
jgi:gamma-glutamyl hercynylcysteine S-oxide synthase